MNKRGKIEIKEIIEVLLAAACVTLLIILMIRVFSPTISVSELAAKNYLESLEIALDEAKETGSSEFLMYLSEPNPYFLVYFGEGYSFDYDYLATFWCGGSSTLDVSFKPTKAKKNSLCICHIDSKDSLKNIDDLEVICKYCIQEKIDNSLIASQSITEEDAVYYYNSKNNFSYIFSGYHLNIEYIKSEKSYKLSLDDSIKISNNLNYLDCVENSNKPTGMTPAY